MTDPPTDERWDRVVVVNWQLNAIVDLLTEIRDRLNCEDRCVDQKVR